MKILTNIISSWWQKQENNTPEVQNTLHSIHDALMCAFGQKWALYPDVPDLRLRLDFAYFKTRTRSGPKLSAVILEPGNPTTFSIHYASTFPSRRVRLKCDADKNMSLMQDGLHVPVSYIPQIIREYAYDVNQVVEPGGHIRRQHVSVIF